MATILGTVTGIFVKSERRYCSPSGLRSIEDHWRSVPDSDALTGTRAPTKNRNDKSLAAYGVSPTVVRNTSVMEVADAFDGQRG